MSYYIKPGGGSPNPYKSGFPWLTEYDVSQAFGVNGETGIDLGTPYHTPITSLTAGQVLGAGYYGGGGVVSVACTVNGQPAAIYYQHLDEIDSAIRVGAAVRAGQQIGLSGGQLSGGAHPSSRQFSNGPHTEVGFNAPYGGMWNPRHYSPNFNPVPELERLAGGAVGVTAPLTLGLGNVGAGAIQFSTAPGFLPIAQMIHDTETFRPIDPTAVGASVMHNAGAWAFRGVMTSLALLIFLAVIFRLAQRAHNDNVNVYNQAMPNIAAAAQFAALL